MTKKSKPVGSAPAKRGKKAPRVGVESMTAAEGAFWEELFARYPAESDLARVDRATCRSLIEQLRLAQALEAEVSANPWTVAKDGSRRPAKAVAALETAHRRIAALRRQLGLLVPDAQRQRRQSGRDTAAEAMRRDLEDLFAAADPDGTLLARPETPEAWAALIEHNLELARAGDPALDDYDGPK